MTTQESSDLASVREVIEDLADAIRNKDSKAAISLYADDIVAYDLAPPLSIDASMERDPAHLQSWFDTWEGSIESKPYRLTVRAGGDIAYAFGLRHMTGTKKGGEKVDLWFRATACLVRKDGRWKIQHMHNSVPFAMDGSDRALLDLTP
jgi:ketosteroid isomerase-like protein